MQRYLRKGNRLTPVLYPARLKATRTKLHPQVRDLPVGQKIGTLVGARSTWVWQGWRDVATYIFGTGRGKTSALVVRHMLEAPGAAVMTTNKVDGVSEVLAGRQHAGKQWLYDPTQVYRHDKHPDFVYNPLDDVQSLTDAQELAAIFEASTKDADSKKDAQFDSQGLDLFAYALLGARLEGKSLRQVFEWIVEPPAPADRGSDGQARADWSEARPRGDEEPARQDPGQRVRHRAADGVRDRE